MNRGGLVGEDQAGNELAVVYEEDAAALHGPFEAGERLRIIHAQREPDGAAIQITRASEVFRLPFKT